MSTWAEDIDAAKTAMEQSKIHRKRAEFLFRAAEAKRKAEQRKVKKIEQDRVRFGGSNATKLSAGRIRTLRIRENGGHFSKQEWRELREKYNHTCLSCGRKEPGIKLHADHVIPVVLGGSSNISNIQPLCAECNSRKRMGTQDYRKRTGGV